MWFGKGGVEANLSKNTVSNIVRKEEREWIITGIPPTLEEWKEEEEEGSKNSQNISTNCKNGKGISYRITEW